MIAYASMTGTKRNIARLRECGWGLLVSPAHRWRSAAPLIASGFRYCLDNGAWSAFQNNSSINEDEFASMLDVLGGGADFVVAPDIVLGGGRSLAYSLSWLPHCLVRCERVLIAVQDGMTYADLREHLRPTVGVFVGGSTEWKKQTMGYWAAVARDHRAWCHVGRVNTTRRIRLCADAGVDSIDGTSASRFAVTTRPLDKARRQTSLLWMAYKQTLKEIP